MAAILGTLMVVAVALIALCGIVAANYKERVCSICMGRGESEDGIRCPICSGAGVL